MKCKLDENLGDLGRDLLAASGHDVSTVAMQGLSGAADEALYEACRTDRRVLITLDRDFGEILRFAPEDAAGCYGFSLVPISDGRLPLRTARQATRTPTSRHSAGRCDRPMVALSALANCDALSIGSSSAAEKTVGWRKESAVMPEGR